MDVSLQNAALAYGKALSRGGEPAAPGEAEAAAGEGASFADFVRQAADSAVSAMDRAEEVSLLSNVGKADLTDVVQAVNNAEIALQTVVAVRDRVIDAYQQIIRMPI